jgi:hypothetical protein
VGKAKYLATKKKSLSGQSKPKSAVARSGTEGKVSSASSATASSWSTIGKKKPVGRATQPTSTGNRSGFAAAFGGDSSDEES